MKTTRPSRPLRPSSDKGIKATRFKSLLLRLVAIYSFIALMALTALLVPAYALSMNIDQPSIKVALKPGETKTGDIFVQNLGGSKLKIKAYTEDWIYAPDGSKTFMKPGSSVYSCSEWIKLDPVTFELSPKEGKKVSYSITSPNNASGGHVSVIFFEGLINTYEGIAVSGRIGAIVYQDTEGDIKRAGEIKELTILTSEEGMPVNLRISFANTGNSHISAKPNIKILENDKMIIETQAMNINTLPGDIKTSIITIDKKLKEGKYKAQVELSFDDKTPRSQTEFTINKSSQK